MEIFGTIKQSVDILDVAAHYGVEVNRHNKALCFIHSEKTPSLSFKHGRYHCFGCGASGDAVGMVAAIRGIEGLEAAKEIDATYSLHLFDKQPSTAEVCRRARKMQAERERVEAFKGWERRACKTWAKYCRMLEHWQREYAPKSPDDELALRYVEACHQLDRVDHIFQTVFIDGCHDMEVQTIFYKQYAEEVVRIEQLIKDSCFAG